MYFDEMRRFADGAAFHATSSICVTSLTYFFAFWSSTNEGYNL